MVSFPSRAHAQSSTSSPAHSHANICERAPSHTVCERPPSHKLAHKQWTDKLDRQHRLALRPAQRSTSCTWSTTLLSRGHEAAPATVAAADATAEDAAATKAPAAPASPAVVAAAAPAAASERPAAAAPLPRGHMEGACLTFGEEDPFSERLSLSLSLSLYAYANIYMHARTHPPNHPRAPTHTGIHIISGKAGAR